ncbi:MAG: phosphatase PAP2 family protein [Ferruginibacter sp.]
MKKRVSILLLLITIASFNGYSQPTDSLVPLPVQVVQQPAQVQNEQVFKIKPWLDISLTTAFAAWSVYGTQVIYNRGRVPEAELMALDKKNINEFDRPIADNYSERSRVASDYFFYGSLPLPLVLLFDKKIRRDGPKIGLLYLETMGATGVIYTISAMSANRFRPYAYNENVALTKRQFGGARNSFFAGHPAMVASSTFFMAQVYTHYHPDMKGKWILYTLAAGATVTTGLLRLQAGQHFRTEVITGVVVGTLVGNLVPYVHINKSYGKNKLALFPNFQHGGTGFTAYYKLGK